MIKTEANNNVTISGRVEDVPQYSHYLYGEAFYSFDMSIPRLSGAEDVLPVTVSERLFDGKLPEAGDYIAVDGQLRSYNKHTENGNKLVLTVFARSVENPEEDEDPVNEITLEGFICKPTVYRTTPFSREIADILVAVNRSYNKSDYLPCIAWGRNARYVKDLPVGTRISLRGRIQSRMYQKTLDDGSSVTKMAYEVSCSSIEVIDGE